MRLDSVTLISDEKREHIATNEFTEAAQIISEALLLILSTSKSEIRFDRGSICGVLYWTSKN